MASSETSLTFAHLKLCFGLLLLSHASVSSPFRPRYPITASWFADRFTKNEWDTTLDEFKSTGGDSVLLRGAQFEIREKGDIIADPAFKGCLGNSAKHCVQEVEDEMHAANLTIAGWATYQYEENFSDKIMICPQYDKKIISTSKTYYRIVIPDGGFSCVYDPKEGYVVIVFTSFAGIDAHELLLQSAAERNMSVYLGVPDVPDISTLPVDHDHKVFMYEAYFYWLYYVFTEHNFRFGNGTQPARRAYESLYPNFPKRPQSYCDDHGKTVAMRKRLRTRLMNKQLSNWSKTIPHKKTPLQMAAEKSFSGYYVRKEVFLSKLATTDSSPEVLGLPFICFFFQLDDTLMYVNENRTVVFSAKINLQRNYANSSIAKHVEGLTSFIENAIASYGAQVRLLLHEGRGMGYGAHYWPSEENAVINAKEPLLSKILHNSMPKLPLNVTYNDVYVASTQTLFKNLTIAWEKATKEPLFKIYPQLWLMIEAYEDLNDEPCLPVDARGSGMDKALDRTSRDRIDKSLGALGGFTQKIAAFAWDSDFLCTNKMYPKNLMSDIKNDMNRPILTSCDFHSPYNLSVIITGFNIDGPYSRFQVTWTDYLNKTHVEHQYGYYYELDYGIQHHKVPSLVYIMLWDFNVRYIMPKGFVKVSIDGTSEYCIYAYDLQKTKE